MSTQTNVWKSVSEQVETVSGFKHYRNQTECEVFQFNQAALHRVKPATENGWRYFFRMALLKKKPLNKIRRQVQVYTTEHGGW